MLHIERSEAGCFDRLAAWLREQGVKLLVILNAMVRDAKDWSPKAA